MRCPSHSTRRSRRALSLVALVLAVGCARPEPVFRVGLIGVLEGTLAASSGVPAQEGARLAVDALNAQGGVEIDGVRHRVVLIERPTAPRPDAASIAARGLINLDSVDVLVGPQQSVLAEAAGAVAEASDVPMVTPMASGPAVTAGRRLVTRLAFIDDVQGAVLGLFAYDSLGVRTAVAFHDAASSYGRDIVALFRETFEARGGRVALVETYAADAPRPHPAAIRRLIAAKPDAILLPTFTVQDSADMRLLRAGGFRGRILGADSWDALAMARRRDALGAIIVANWDRRAGRPPLDSFRLAWGARFDGRPRATAAATYDAVRLLAMAASRARVRTGAPLADALRSMGPWEGAFGRYDFIGTGDPVRPAVLLEVRAESTFSRAVLAPPR